MAGFLQVGSQWDPKEEMFRNYGSFLGPNDDVTLAIRTQEGARHDDVTVSIVILDPTDVVAGSYQATLKGEEHVTTLTTEFRKPLRPGWLNSCHSSVHSPLFIVSQPPSP